MRPIHRRGAAGSPRPISTSTLRSRTCRCACSRRRQALPAAASRSATRFSTSPPRSSLACSMGSPREPRRPLAARRSTRCARSAARRALRSAAASATFSMPMAASAPRSKRCGRSSFTAPTIAASSFRPRSATTPTSSPAFITPPTRASCSARTIRYCPTTNTCRSAITGAPPPSPCPASRCAARTANAKGATETNPSFGPCRSLDYELELGVWIGPGNELGTPIAIADAASHIAGFCLLNDWSARDIQAWEYQPLGPFLGKSFFTTISPWVVTPEALAPFRTAQAARSAGDPAPLPYLCDAADQATGALDIELEVFLLTPGLKSKALPPQRLSVGNARHLYWTVAQLVAHHSSGGCNLRAGDLFGTGTISAPQDGGLGSLLEISAGGRRPVELASGESRRFLEDGDTVIMRAHCAREGFATIGLGECRGTIAPAI